MNDIKSYEPFNILYGERSVLKGGKIRFNQHVYQSDELIPYIGDRVVVKRDEEWAAISISNAESAEFPIIIYFNTFSWMSLRIEKPLEN